MKHLVTIMAFMATTTAFAQNGKATTVKKTFSRTTTVATDIKAAPAIIWQLLTDAARYPAWNSTIISIEGKIAMGEKIKLKAKLAPKRTFKLKVKEMNVPVRLVWGDGQGQRVYTISDKGNGIASFSMTEKIGGFMFPLYAKHIPSFDKPFEDFAADLKKEAEKIQGIQ